MEGQAIKKRPLRVVVVEDNTDYADILKKLMDGEGYEVRCAYDGITALKEITQFLPDVVLLDLALPDISGYEVARRLEETGRTQYMIAITGHNSPLDRRRTAAFGINEHLRKPVNPHELLEILKQVQPSGE